MISSANSLAINLAGIATILQLLCWRDNSAISGIQARAHLIPWCLLALNCTPCPLPQNKIPNSQSPFLQHLQQDVQNLDNLQNLNHGFQNLPIHIFLLIVSLQIPCIHSLRDLRRLLFFHFILIISTKLTL